MANTMYVIVIVTFYIFVEMHCLCWGKSRIRVCSSYFFCHETHQWHKRVSVDYFLVRTFQLTLRFLHAYLRTDWCRVGQSSLSSLSEGRRETRPYIKSTGRWIMYSFAERTSRFIELLKLRFSQHRPSNQFLVPQ